MNITTFKNAKRLPAENAERYRRKLRSNGRIIDTARRLWPLKTALQVHEITKYPLRTVESWLDGTVKIPSDALVSLFHHEQGREFLAAVMDDKRPRWWLQVTSYFAAVDSVALSRAARRVLRRAFDATETTAAAIQRADALLVQDADFYGEHAAAVRVMASFSDRALAPKGKVK